LSFFNVLTVTAELFLFGLFPDLPRDLYLTFDYFTLKFILVLPLPELFYAFLVADLFGGVILLL
jgi:hypothetical protein